MPRLLTPGERQRLLALERTAARQQLARLRAKQAHRREAWLRRKTMDLAKRHGVVVVEDLRIGNLTRSARGTAARPGTNVKAKEMTDIHAYATSWARGLGLLDG